MKCIEVTVILLLLRRLEIVEGCIFPAVSIQRPPTDATDNAQPSEDESSSPLSSPELWTCEIPDDCPENGACTYLWLGTSVCCSKPKTKKNKFPRNFRPLLNRIENDNSIVDYEAHEALAALQRAQHSKPRLSPSGATSMRSDQQTARNTEWGTRERGRGHLDPRRRWPSPAGRNPEEISPSDQFDKTISEIEESPEGSLSNDQISEKSQSNADDTIGSPQKTAESEQSKGSIRRFHAKDDKRFAGILHERMVPKATVAFPTVSQLLIINRRTSKTTVGLFSRSLEKSMTTSQSDATAKGPTRPLAPEFQKIDQSTRFQGFMEKIRKKPMFESRSFATPASTYFTKGTAYKTTPRKSPPNCGTNDRACEKTSRNRLTATVPLAPNLSHYQTSKPTTVTRNFRLYRRQIHNQTDVT